MINGFSSMTYNTYSAYGNTNYYPSYSMNPIPGVGDNYYGFNSNLSPIASVKPIEKKNQISDTSETNLNHETSKIIRTSSAGKVKPTGKESSPAECETCSNRKYQDGSNENVSFKSPTRISPQAAATAVRAHENEHVNNAYTKAAKNNGRVLSANVAIHTDICPECGRSYVSGGTTTTQIKYYNEDNPYQKLLKGTDAVKYKGRMIDIAC